MTQAPGEKLSGRFEIVRQIGEGGMGVVYEARDHERNTRVALKTLPGMQPSGLYRFKQEFRALAAIAHPNLVALHELVAEGDLWFFTMELVDGAVDFLEWVRPVSESVDASISDVRSKPGSAAGDATAVQLAVAEPLAVGARSTEAPPAIARGRAPDPDRLRAAFIGLVDGVSAIHAAGKLHRDLKPANVLVRPNGHVSILDFGLIADLHEAHAPVSAGSALSVHATDQGVSGTAGYMAPEQALGAPLDASADTYAIGGMLFHALTGSLPFDGSVNDVLFRKQVEDAPRASELADGVPADLDELAAALLSRDRAARPTLDRVRAVLVGSATIEADASETDGEEGAFVGREQPAAALFAALAATRAGATVVCRVHGPSGAGKSALLAHFASDLPGATKLSGRCLEQEAVPFKALDGVVDALTHVLLSLPSELRHAVVPDDLSLLARLFPVLGRVVPATVDAFDIATLRARACAALAFSLEQLAAHGTVVVLVDDLQWSDVDGAELLGEAIIELARRRAPVLFVLGYRSEYEHRSAGLAALSATLARSDARVTERAITVGPLAPNDARGLALRLLGPDGTNESAAWVARASDGLPWFIHELSRAVRAGTVQMGESVAGVMERRASSLSNSARRILDVVALAGRPLRLGQVRDALDQESMPEELLRSLRAGSWIRTTGPRLDDLVESFHDRVREGITASLPVARRRALHGALARVLDGDAPREVVAEHHEGAGNIDAAATAYETAADEARRVFALTRAEGLYQRAVRLHTVDAARARVVVKQIHHLTDTARFGDAYALGRRAVAAYGVSLPGAASPPRLVAGLARVLWRMRGHEPASLLELPPMTDARAKTAMALLAAAMKAAYQVRPELCVIVANESVDLCLQHGNSVDSALGYMVHGAIFRGGVMGRHRTGHAFGRLARALVDRYENEAQRAEVSFVVGYFGTSWIEPATRAEALWAEAFDAGLRSGDLFHTGCAASGTMASLWMRGAPLSDIVARGDEYLDTLVPRGLDEAVITVTGLRRVAVALMSGEALDAGSFDLRAHEAKVDGLGSKHFALLWHTARAAALLAAERPHEAHAVIRGAASMRGSARGMLHGVELDYLETLALAHAAVGASRARRMMTAARVAATAARWGTLADVCEANFRAKASLLRAEAKRLVQGAQAARGAFDDAAELARLHGMPHVEALAHRGAGDTRGAADALARWGVRATFA